MKRVYFLYLKNKNPDIPMELINIDIAYNYEQAKSKKSNFCYKNSDKVHFKDVFIVSYPDD